MGKWVRGWSVNGCVSGLCVMGGWCWVVCVGFGGGVGWCGW